MSKRILAIAGSSSSTSINKLLLAHACTQLADFEVEQITVLDFPAPFFSVDVEQSEGLPAPIADLHARIQAADGVIIASPEHNGLMPALLKNTIDWLTRVKSGQKFMEKPLLLLSTSPGGYGGRTNVETMAKLSPRWGATAVSTFSLARFHETFDQANGVITDAESAKALRYALGTFEAAL